MSEHWECEEILRNCKKRIWPGPYSKCLRNCRVMVGEVKLKTIPIVMLNIFYVSKFTIIMKYETFATYVQIIYKLVKQYCEYRERHLVSVTKMALVDHQVESMATRDGW